MSGETSQDWPGLTKAEKEERLYFEWIKIDGATGNVEWCLRLRDETEREAALAQRVRTLDDLEKTELASRVDLIHTAAERDAVWA